MTVPNADRAIIATEKLTGYLQLCAPSALSGASPAWLRHPLSVSVV
jgi:hypothetical protein